MIWHVAAIGVYLAICAGLATRHLARNDTRLDTRRNP